MINVLKILGKIVKWIFYLITAIIICLTIYIIAVISLSDNEELWTYKAYTVLSDSMQDTFESGDVVIIKKTEAENLQAGDIIAFYSIDPYTEGEVYTHKIREVTTYNGELAFTTYGTTTGDDDLYPATAENVIGELVYVVPNIGEFVQFFQSAKGYVLIIVIPILICLFLEIRNLLELVKKKDDKIVETNDEFIEPKDEFIEINADFFETKSEPKPENSNSSSISQDLKNNRYRYASKPVRKNIFKRSKNND